MQNAKDVNFTRLADGTLLQRLADGTFRAVEPATDHVRLAGLTDDEIEDMTAPDPDHPALDDAFRAGGDQGQPAKETISIRLDKDILSFFRREGE